MYIIFTILNIRNKNNMYKYIYSIKYKIKKCKYIVCTLLNIIYWIKTVIWITVYDVLIEGGCLNNPWYLHK